MSASVDILACYENEPQELDFVLPGYLHGTVGVLYSAGGSGKSMLMLEAAMSIACSVAGGDLLGVNPQAHGRVVYLSAEDPKSVIENRVHHMTRKMTWQAVHAIADNLDIQAIEGSEIDIFDPEHFQRIVDYTAEARLIVLDTVSCFHSKEENSNAEMAQLIGRFKRLIKETGASVLFLHHQNKASSRDGETEQTAMRGASSLIDNARFAASLRRMNKDECQKLSDDDYNGKPIGEDRRGYFCCFEVPKNNYDNPLSNRWYQRGTGGVLTPIELIDSDPYGPSGK